MHIFITAPVLSVALWWALMEYGFLAIGFAMIALSFLYIVTTIWRDWTPFIAPKQEDDCGYGRFEQ